jgi:hypothetical protein
MKSSAFVRPTFVVSNRGGLCADLPEQIEADEISQGRREQLVFGDFGEVGHRERSLWHPVEQAAFSSPLMMGELPVEQPHQLRARVEF